MVHSGPQERPSIPTAPGSISNARLVAELQGLTIGIHMFGLDGLANMTAERAYETPENEQVQS